MVNEITLVGRLGQAPVARGNNGPVVTSIATTSKYKDKAGKFVDSTQWHNLVFWGKMRDTATYYLQKGSLIYVKGRVEYGEYQNKEGVKVKTTNIVVSTMQMLEKRTDNAQQNPPQMAKPEQAVHKHKTIAQQVTGRMGTTEIADTSPISIEDIPF